MNDGRTPLGPNDPSTEMPKDPVHIPSLNDITFSFTVTPGAIRAGDTVTVRWSATVPRTLGGVTFDLNGASVSSSGSIATRPVVDTAYSLAAHRYGFTRALGRQVVSVDPSTCTLTGPSQKVVDLELYVKEGTFSVFAPDKHYTTSVSGVTLYVVQEAIDNLTLELEPATGLLRLTLPLRINIDGLSGDGRLTARIWFQLLAVGGRVMVINVKTETDLSLPWDIWLVALLALFGPAGFTIQALIIGLLNGLGPDLASGKISGDLGPIQALISDQFGDRVIAVRTGMASPAPGEPAEPFVFTTACP
jgi:hypothetical protein